MDIAKLELSSWNIWPFKLMKMAAKNDFRSVIQTFCCVAAYVLIGAGIFYAIEYTDDFDAEMSRKKQLLNKTKFEVKKRFGINETVFETLVQKVIDANSRTPLQWTYTRGIDLCWQTVTTVGMYKLYCHLQS